MKIFYWGFTILLLCSYAHAQKQSGSLLKPNTNDNTNYIAGNEILMWVGNNGMSCHDPRNDGAGFYWPGGEQAVIPAIFSDGLLWGGKVNGNLKVGGATYRYGLQAGKILTGSSADNPELSKYRIYKIRKGIINTDYEEWPVEDGAPWEDINGDGVFTKGIDEPQFLGDETLWYVMNDLDSSRTHYLYGTDPIGLEVQVTIWASMEMPDVVFKKYIIINKSGKEIKDMYLAQWSDPDLGNANDDYVGCDTTLSLAYCWNGDNDDTGFYSENPPAVGYTMLQGPLVQGLLEDTAISGGITIPGYKNMPLTSFVFYIGADAVYQDPDLGVSFGANQIYNYMQGYLWDGSPFIDPNTGLTTKFCLSGDPYLGTGWYEGAGWPGGKSPSDRRILASFGPFTMKPYEAQEIVIAVHMARGENYIHSVKKLKDQSRILHYIYKNPDWFKFSARPNVHSNADDEQITLWWDSNVENFELTDYNLLFSGLEDTTFSFEGYRVWQFSDALGNDPVEVAVFDKQNGIFILYGYETIEGQLTRIPIVRTKDEGISRFIRIGKDYYSNSTLLNGKKYYFGVTAFAYSPNNGIQLLESEPNIIEAIPGRNPIDYTFDFNTDEYIIGQHSQGDGDGSALIKIIDESELNGDTYEVKIFGTKDSVYYSIKDISNNAMIVDSTNAFYPGKREDEFFSGKSFIITNTGRDSINYLANSKRSRIKEILEISNGSGQLDHPVNVMNNLNSTNSWMGTFYNPYTQAEPNIENCNFRDNLGYDDYEIRFTSSGSEYYPLPTRIGLDIADGIKSNGRVPFEVWNIDKNERLTIKIQDWNKNGVWDIDSSSRWESIFAVDEPSYIEPMPTNSSRTTTSHSYINYFVIDGEIPEEGTVIRINTWKPLRDGDVFTIATPKPNFNDLEAAKERINEITVFPNPFFDNTQLNHGERKITFTNLPDKVIVRIFTLAGTFVTRLEKDSESPWLDWDLKNSNGKIIGGGIYIAYIEMPGIGNKIIKIAVVL